jgi:hypothetical protein
MSGKSSPEPIWSPAEPSARRSLILCSLGAVLGLVIAGVGLFTAKGTRTPAVPAEDVALVNQVPILMSDYLVQLRALDDVSLSEATREQKRKVLDDMIREELYVQRGVELGLQSDVIEVRTALVGAVEAEVAADATMAQPDEAELRAYYDRNVAQYASEGRMELDDFLVEPGARLAPAAAAAALRRTLDRSRGGVGVSQDGSDASRFGLRRTAVMNSGEEFYFAAKIHLGEPLFEAAVRLKTGDVSDPVAAADGVHILVMKKNVTPIPRSYADARGTVLHDFIDEQSKILTAGNDRFLRKRADIAVAHGFE